MGCEGGDVSRAARAVTAAVDPREARAHGQCAGEDGGQYRQVAVPAGPHTDYAEDIFSDGMQHGEQKSEIWDVHPEPSAVNVSVQQASPGDSGDKIDMFGDDENANENLPVPSAEQADQPTSGNLGSSQDLDSGAVGHGGDGNDYVYDQTSG
ncbi:hypothetical protein GW17_00028934 [Ensete ventricosum]|nr:hypothetical protein GW17_00028934 [Ensete ventricosum]